MFLYRDVHIQPIGSDFSPLRLYIRVDMKNHRSLKNGGYESAP
jgi:hypothetical protein